MDLAIFATSQRAGSTLVQRIFNARPKTLVWGEGGRVLSYLCHALGQAELYAADSKDLLSPYLANRTATPDALLGTLPNLTPDPATLHGGFVEAARAYFNSTYQRPEYDMIGMKEVNHDADAVMLFRAAFPNAHLILLCRDPVHAWRSIPPSWRVAAGLDPSLFIAQWNERYRDYHDICDMDGAAHFIHYEDLLACDPEVFAILSRVGRLSTEQIKAVLRLKRGSHSDVYEHNPRSHAWIRDSCAAPRYRCPDGSAAKYAIGQERECLGHQAARATGQANAGTG